MSAEGISVVYISHFLEEVRQISDRFTVLRDGRSVATGDIAATSDDELIAKMVGRSQQNLFPQRSHPTAHADPILEVRNLMVPPLLKDASFELRRGENTRHRWLNGFEGPLSEAFCLIDQSGDSDINKNS